MATQTETPKKSAAIKDTRPYQKRFSALKAALEPKLPLFKELSRFMNPTKGFFDSTVPDGSARIDYKTVISGHARRCVRTLASGMSNGITSPARPWFRLTVSNTAMEPSQEVQIWLDAVQKKILDIFAKSNIYGCLHAAYEEAATFGTAAIFLNEDFYDVMRGRVFTAGEYYLGCGPDGRVNAFGRAFQMTVGQLIAEFGEENVSEGVKTKYKDHQVDQLIKVNCLVEVNDDRIPDQVDFKNMAYRCLYWEEGNIEDKFLRVDGYKIFPVLAIRWDTTTTQHVWGCGPGEDSLGDTKMIQKQYRDKLLAVDKVGNPPVQMDASITGEFNSLPGGVTRSSSSVPNTGVRAAYEVRPDVAAMQESINETKREISESMYSDLFRMIMNSEGPPKTAAEIYAKQSEALQILGPFLERFNNEGLNHLMEWIFELAFSNNLLPPPPSELSGANVDINYISILAVAQRMAGITAVDQWAVSVLEESKFNPESADIIDFDAKNREKAEMLAIPQKMVASQETIAAKRKARADAQAKAQNLQAMELAAKAAGAGAGAVKDMATAPMGAGSALDSTLTALTGGQ